MGSLLLGHTVEAKIWQKNLFLFYEIFFAYLQAPWDNRIQDITNVLMWKDDIWDKLSIHTVYPRSSDPPEKIF